MREMQLNQFMQSFGSSLTDAVMTQMNPVYQGEESQDLMRDIVLDDLKRPPFDAQKHRIHAVTNLLIDQDAPAAIINADMGTGKTQMAVSVASLLSYEGAANRFLILSPPHLVYKWRREIREIMGSDTKVTVLNGADSLVKLLALRDTLSTPTTDEPEFFVVGRVRMRMGFHWKPAYQTKSIYREIASTQSFVKETVCACPDCGKPVQIRQKDELITLTPSTFPKDRRLQCLGCETPLWTLQHPKKPLDKTEQLQRELQRIPSIGPKTANNLISAFGEEFMQTTLTDNHFELVNLLDEEGEFYFSDKQAKRIEKSFANLEFSLGQGGYQITEFIKRYLPNNFFQLAIVDEGHEYKNYGTAQGQAMGVLCNKVEKILCLTGTLMGGYADDIFYLLWRLMPKTMIAENFKYKHGGLQSAAMDWLKAYGSLETIYKTTENSLKTSNANGTSVSTKRKPGFSPYAVVKHILPYTVFLRLSDIGQGVLPDFNEYTHWISMDSALENEYEDFAYKLTTEMNRALAKGDTTLMGAVFSSLMSYPDSAFMDMTVRHPRDRNNVIAYAGQIYDNDQVDSKSKELLNICRDNKSKGRRVLVYTSFTDKRDTTKYLKALLTNEGFKVDVLKSSVSTELREDWILDKVDKGCEVLICNPELVKTGLDLLEFPTICFMQTGWNVYTLMQARMRSYRIGQEDDVDIHYLGYANCAQQQCMELMVKKVEVSQSTSGEIPDCGLDALNAADDESLESMIARDLAGMLDGSQKPKSSAAPVADTQMSLEDFFGEPISSYTRADALADGVLVDVTDSDEFKELRFTYPIALTREVYDDCVLWDEKAREKTYQDETGRLWDVLYMFKERLRTVNKADDTVFYELYRVPRTGRGITAKKVQLKAVVSGGDDGKPVITISTPNQS